MPADSAPIEPRGPRRGTASEVGELSRAAAVFLDVVAETVEQTHRGIARRAFGATGPLGLVPRAIHDSIASLTYRAVRTGLRGAGNVFGLVADHHPHLRRQRPLATPRGERLLSAASGIVGDRIADEHPLLDVGFALRHDGRVVEPADLAALHADAGGELAVFLHGLCESDRSWWRLSRVHRAAAKAGDTVAARVVTHGERLAEAHGMTPLYVRYNTGRRIHLNGWRFAQLLEETVEAWPVEVERLALIGHSMGGLVLRSACHQAEEAGQRWPTLVDDIVYLGTPHLGAPLARGVDAASNALARLPETRGITGLLGHRSEGVRDLVRGDILEGAVAAEAPEEALHEAAGDPPALEGARHHLLAATITEDPDHPFGRLVGDALVRSASGSGRSRSRDLGLGDDVVIQGGIDHFDLLSDPRVGEQIVEWLTPPS